LIQHVENHLRTDAKPREDAEIGTCECHSGIGDVWYRAGILVKELLESRRYKPFEIAVLCRDNGRENYPVGCFGVAQALKAFNIPHKRVARDGNLWESNEVRNMIYTLNLIMNASDRASWSMAVDFPFRRISQQERINIKKAATFGRINLLEASRGFSPVLDSWVDAIEELSREYRENTDQSCVEFFKKVVDRLQWRSHFKPLIGRKFAIILERIKMQMRDLQNNGNQTVLDFIEWWLSREALHEDHSVNAVEISTIHGYKGLQKRIVVIPGISKGHFPKLSKAGLNLDEEVRILYVGITRAEDECFLLYQGEPSEFIEWCGFFDKDETDAKENDDFLF
jgi:DNA helicase-2/ATP-dependent DNA helicase PcrA